MRADGMEFADAEDLAHALLLQLDLNTAAENIAD